MARPYHEEYADLFCRLPEGYALYNVEEPTRMGPGDVGYFDNFGAWNRLDDLGIEGRNEEQDGIERFLPVRISSQEHGATKYFSGGVDLDSSGVVNAKVNGVVNFQSGSQRIAVCAVEPVTRRHLVNAPLAENWIRGNAVNLVDKYARYIDDHGLWLVTATFTTRGAAMAIFDSNLNASLTSVIVPEAKRVQLDLSQSSWENAVGGVAQVVRGNDNQGSVVVFFQGKRFFRYGQTLHQERKLKNFLVGDANVFRRLMREIWTWFRNKPNPKGTRRTERLTADVAPPTVNAAKKAEARIKEASKAVRVRLDNGDEYEFEYEEWGTTNDEQEQPTAEASRGKSRLSWMPKLPGKPYNTQPKGEPRVKPQQEPELPGRALLIGSPNEGLKGTENDVASMVKILENYGFRSITTRTGCNATREKIMTAWRRLIDESLPGDAVVIYYSGHGGYATRKPEQSTAQQKPPSHFQFLIPCDFDPNDPPEKWKGILDIEISRLLYDTTAKTQNVTYILDCCHSALLGKAPDSRTPGEKPPVAKVQTIELEGSKYDEIWRTYYSNAPDLQIPLPNFADPNYSNPDVVRIAAAAAGSVAWQRYNRDNSWVGMMTESLVKGFAALGKKMSWLNIMVAVGELVKREFSGDPQQPRSAGADSRIPFSMEIDSTMALWADVREDNIVIQGGHALGVKEGDVYELWPWDTPKPESTKITGIIKRVYGFAADAKQNFGNPLEPCVAFVALSQRQTPLPVALHVRDNHDSIQQWLQRSPKFKAGDNDDECVVKLRQEDTNIVLYGRGSSVNNVPDQDVRLGSRPLGVDGSDINRDMESLSKLAEAFARAQNIVSLKSGTRDEEFCPDVALTVGRFDSRGNEDQNPMIIDTNTDRPATQVNPIELNKGDRVYFEMRNKTARNDEKGDVYVSLLSVDVTGKINILSLNQGERGIQLTNVSRNASLKRLRSGDQGVPVHWPEGVPMDKTIYEHFVFVVTPKEIDLRFLETPRPEYVIGAKDAAVGAKGPLAVAGDLFSIEPLIPYYSAPVPYSLTSNNA